MNLNIKNIKKNYKLSFSNQQELGDLLIKMDAKNLSLEAVVFLAFELGVSSMQQEDKRKWKTSLPILINI